MFEEEICDETVRGATAVSSLQSAVMDAMDSDSEEEIDGADLDSPHRNIRQEVTKELGVYLQQPIIKMDVDPFMYWTSRRDTFPLLSPVAAVYLACPPSSVTSERMFSVAGDILSKKRCSLTPENLQMLAMIKVNKKYVRKVEV